MISDSIVRYQDEEINVSVSIDCHIIFSILLRTSLIVHNKIDRFYNAVFQLLKRTFPDYGVVAATETCWNIVLFYKKNFLKSLCNAYCWSNFYITNLINMHIFNNDVINTLVVLLVKPTSASGWFYYRNILRCTDP